MATTQEIEAKLKSRIKELEKMDQDDLVAMAKKMGLNTKSTSKKRLASLVARKELREGARAQQGQISAKEAFERTQSYLDEVGVMLSDVKPDAQVLPIGAVVVMTYSNGMAETTWTKHTPLAQAKRALMEGLEQARETQIDTAVRAGVINADKIKEDAAKAQAAAQAQQGDEDEKPVPPGAKKPKAPAPSKGAKGPEVA